MSAWDTAFMVEVWGWALTGRHSRYTELYLVSYSDVLKLFVGHSLLFFLRFVHYPILGLLESLGVKGGRG